LIKILEDLIIKNVVISNGREKYSAVNIAAMQVANLPIAEDFSSFLVRNDSKVVLG